MLLDMKKASKDDQTKKERLFPNESIHDRDTLGHVVVIIVCLLLLYFAFVLPLAPIYAARHWTAVPCTIIASGMRSDHSAKEYNQKFTEDVVYSYEVAGKTHQGTRYKFLEGWYTRSEKGPREAEFVAHYRPGRQTTCYVNPSNPTDVVLDRGLGVPALLLVGPAALVCIVVSAPRFRQQFRRWHCGAPVLKDGIKRIVNKF
jgi:hypothetical protein